MREHPLQRGWTQHLQPGPPAPSAPQFTARDAPVPSVTAGVPGASSPLSLPALAVPAAHPGLNPLSLGFFPRVTQDLTARGVPQALQGNP